MILQALAAHYEDLARRGEAERPGWGPAKVSFALVLSETGDLLQAASLKTQQQMGKKLVTAPQVLTVPMPKKRTVGIEPNFLCDNAGYLLGIDDKGKPERTRKCFEAAKALHLKLLEGVDSPAARAVCAFFSRWDPAEAGSAPTLAEDLEELKQGGNLVFQYGSDYVHEDPAVRACWQAAYDQVGDGGAQTCLVTGERAAPVSLHPSIKGVPGAQSSGASLVSFNAPSLESYGHEQGGNSPTSQQAAFAYGTALNALIADREHRQSYGDTTVVFWAEGGEPAYQDLLNAALFGGGAEAGIDNAYLKGIFSDLAHGKPVDFGGATLRPDRHFYILGLSPNAARLSVRFFLRDSFGRLMHNVDAHYKRMEIPRPAKSPGHTVPLWAILWETVNQHAQNKTPSPVMTGATARAILSGGRYPVSLYHGILLRVLAERKVGPNRAAILKTYLLRNHPNETILKEEMTLPICYEKEGPVFLLGCLLALLEKIQQEAIEGIGQTLVDKFLPTACSTPSQIFDSLLEKSRYHLRKIGGKFGRRDDLRTLLDVYHQKCPTGFPEHLSHVERGEFMVGYYLKNLELWSSKKGQEKEDE